LSVSTITSAASSGWNSSSSTSRLSSISFSELEVPDFLHSDLAENRPDLLQKDSLVPAVVSKLSSQPTQVSDLQKSAMKTFNMSPLNPDQIETTISDLFLKMASEISPSNPHAIRDIKAALFLNPSDQKIRAKLLMRLGDAYQEIQNPTAAIKYFQWGVKLENISNLERVMFRLRIGNALLDRHQQGDSVKAMHQFTEGVKLVHNNVKMKTELYRGIIKCLSQTLPKPLFV
jgi:hypothetical protein